MLLNQIKKIKNIVYILIDAVFYQCLSFNSNYSFCMDQLTLSWPLKVFPWSYCYWSNSIDTYVLLFHDIFIAIQISLVSSSFINLRYALEILTHKGIFHFNEYGNTCQMPLVKDVYVHLWSNFLRPVNICIIWTHYFNN